MAIEYYADIDADYANAPYATINAYFELLPDQEEGQFDGDAPPFKSTGNDVNNESNDAGK